MSFVFGQSTTTNGRISEMARVEDLIDDKLEDILAVPEQWGGEVVLEPLVLTLLQLRVEATRGKDAGAELVRRYRTHLRKSVGPGPLPLLERIAATHSPLAATEILRSFWIAERAMGAPRLLHRARESLFEGEVDVGQPHYRLREVS
jgi:hypothetical protein